MPDISMCDNDKCEDKKTCYRYMAVPSEHQSFIHIEETTKETCAHYCKLEKWDKVRYERFC